MQEDHPLFSVAENVYTVVNSGRHAERDIDWICGYCAEEYHEKYYNFQNAQIHVVRE